MVQLMKRPAAHAVKAAPAEKKAKVAPPPKEKALKRDKRFDEVAAGIQSVETLPSSAMTMLTSMLEHALGTCKERRDKYQEKVVDMIEKIFRDWEANLEQEYEQYVKSGEAATDQQDAAKGIVAQRVQELEAQQQQTTARKNELAEAAIAFRTARQAVEELELEQASANVEFERTVKQKDKLENNLNNSLRPLLSQGGTAEEVGSFVDELQKFGFDESMLIALPGALSKAPEGRTPFDTLVLNQVEEEVAKHLAAFEKTIKDAEPARASRLQTMGQATAKLEQAKKLQVKRADEYTKASKEDESRNEIVKAARKEVTVLGQQAKKERDFMEQTFRGLRIFQTGPKVAFESLRDKSVASETVPIEAPEETMDGIEVAASAIEEVPVGICVA